MYFFHRNERAVPAAIQSTNSNLPNVSDVIVDWFINVTFEIVEKGISKTVFSNGVVLYANHNSDKVNSSIGALEPYQFIIKG
mgnify:CR=1 FL=1